jgi:hypothetical protein
MKNQNFRTNMANEDNKGIQTLKTCDNLIKTFKDTYKLFEKLIKYNKGEFKNSEIDLVFDGANQEIVLNLYNHYGEDFFIKVCTNADPFTEENKEIVYNYLLLNILGHLFKKELIDFKIKTYLLEETEDIVIRFKFFNATFKNVQRSGATKKFICLVKDFYNEYGILNFKQMLKEEISYYEEKIIKNEIDVNLDGDKKISNNNYDKLYKKVKNIDFKS